MAAVEALPRRGHASAGHVAPFKRSNGRHNNCRAPPSPLALAQSDRSVPRVNHHNNSAYIRARRCGDVAHVRRDARAALRESVCVAPRVDRDRQRAGEAFHYDLINGENSPRLYREWIEIVKEQVEALHYDLIKERIRRDCTARWGPAVGRGPVIRTDSISHSLSFSHSLSLSLSLSLR